MRTYLLFTFYLLLAGCAYGQTSFFEDFESYNVGDAISANSEDFIIWPTVVSQDAVITDERASSGEKSLYLPGGEDVDILLELPEQYTEGAFNLSWEVFIPEGRNAYFNFQGSDAIGTPGNWVLQCYLSRNGLFEVDDGTRAVFSNAYPQDEWITIELDVNLTEGLWRMFINDECLGSFAPAAGNNQIYAVNYFPDDGNSLAFVDNISYTYDPNADNVDISLDALAFLGMDVDAGIGIPTNSFFGLSGTEQNFAVNVGNPGIETIESFTINIEGAGLSITEDVNLTIPPGEFRTYNINQPITYTNREEVAQYSLTNINGLADDNTCNNSSPLSFMGFQPAANKKVMVEEITGTWCPQCPRGDVYMNYMKKKYPDHFVGVAVHGGDPMDYIEGTEFPWLGVVDDGNTTVNEGTNLGSLTQGFPNSVINRVPESRNLFASSRQLEEPFMESVQEAPLAILTPGAQFDETTRTLDVNVKTDFTLVALRDAKLMVGLMEDGVTGPGDGTNDDNRDYDQVNAYAGGGMGPMAGYEVAPNPRPATDMVYNSVARHLFTAWAGLDDAYANTSGNADNHVFSFEIPEEWNVDNLKIVSAFVQGDGIVNNCNASTIAQAIANGFVNTIDLELDAAITVAPNPTTDVARITLDFETPMEVTMSVGDAMGQMISNENLGTISGTRTIEYNAADLGAGVYYLRFRSGNTFTTKKLVVTE